MSRRRGARRVRPRTTRPKGGLWLWSAGLSVGALRAGFENHIYTLVSSLGRMARKPLNSLLTIGVIGVALSLPAALFTGLKNLEGLSSGWERLGDIAVYLSPGAAESAAQELGDRIRADSRVASVVMISPEQARDDLSQVAGFGDALAALESNPLPYVLVIAPANRDETALTAMAAELAAMDGVDSAQYDQQWLTRFNRFMVIGRRAVEVMTALLSAAVLLIVGNTIRLDIENRRQEIEVSKLLGATDGFIRRPFLYGGFWYGALGGLCASLLVFIVAIMLQGPVAGLADAYNSSFRLSSLGPIESLQLMGAGALIGWLGSWLAVGRQLAAIQPD